MTESFNVAVRDGNDEPVTHTVEFKIAGSNDAPIIQTENLSVEDVAGTPYDATVLGLSISDVDAGAQGPLTVTAQAQDGALKFNGAQGEPSQTLSFEGTLSEINTKLLSGITYVADNEPAETDKVTLTITDALGATDKVNFVFNVTGEEDIALFGTQEKDIIFGTGHNDELKGNGANDAFVFSFNEQQIGDDVIADFHAYAGADMDKIFFDAAPFSSFAELDIQQVGCDTLIDLGYEGSIILTGVDAQQLSAANFIFHPI